MNLNEDQIKAINTEGNVLVVAGAGSGKTTVLTERVKMLLNKGVNPNRIMTVTFTNKASYEMKNRINNDLIRIGTFHTFAINELRYLYSNFSGKLKKNFTIIDEEDSKKLIQNIVTSSYPDLDKKIYKEIYNCIKMAKTFGYTKTIKDRNEDVWEEVTSKMNIDKTVLDKVFAKYQKILQYNNQMDFDDVLLYFNEYCRLGFIKTDIDYILIDEAQDMNRIQFDMINLIRKPTTTVFAVGDADQTIYSWRGSDSNFFIEKLFQNQEYTLIELKKNYRSGSKILDSANSLIENNKSYFPRTNLSSGKNDDEIKAKVSIGTFPSGQSEMEALAEKLLMQDSLNSTVILYRSSVLLPSIKKMLNDADIPYFLPEETIQLFETPMCKLALKAINLLIDDANNLNVLNFITDAKVCGPKVLKEIKKKVYNAEENFWLYGKFTSGEIDSITTDSVSQINLKTLHYKVEKARSQMVANVLSVYDLLVDYLTRLNCFNEDVSTMLLPLKDVPCSSDSNQAISLFLNDVYSQIREKNAFKETEQDGKVSVMTLHQSKGLEFDNVYIVGVDNTIFPKNDAECEEDRRLLFVGMTRARKNLSISCAYGRLFYGTFFKTGPSKLIKEIKH